MFDFSILLKHRKCFCCCLNLSALLWRDFCLIYSRTFTYKPLKYIHKLMFEYWFGMPFEPLAHLTWIWLIIICFVFSPTFLKLWNFERIALKIRKINTNMVWQNKTKYKLNERQNDYNIWWMCIVNVNYCYIYHSAFNWIMTLKCDCRHSLCVLSLDFGDQSTRSPFDLITHSFGKS